MEESDEETGEVDDEEMDAEEIKPSGLSKAKLRGSFRVYLRFCSSLLTLLLKLSMLYFNISRVYFLRDSWKRT